ncbi:MAG TPA: translocation/assembly module TamB domain-containing protein [Gemmatimonadaceae bacterium]|nr:translocation/assembly module TamB domain-containing protein [Gemmatimonadaceae bacterium]
MEQPDDGRQATGDGEIRAHPRRDRREAVQILQFTAVFLTGLIAFAFVAVLVLSGTDWGRERVRRFVIGQLQGFVHGQVTIGRISGNLLTGATIDAFAIRDSTGQPFVAAERVSARYSILQLITRKIDLRSVTLVRPLIVLDRPPGGKWNYQRIFPPSDTTKPQQVRRSGFPWIVLHDLAVLEGHLIMRTPWKPDTTLSRAAQDSSIHEALGGGKRIMVVPVANGYQKIVELQSLTARAPLLRITQPGFHERLAQIATLHMVALPFRPPSAIVNDLIGNLRFNNDSVWWQDIAVRMPGSSLRGDGRYVFTTGDMTLAAHARPASFADFRFVFPRFPSEGGGTLDFAMEWRGTTQEYVVKNADVHTQGARLRGKFAISFADTLSIHDTDVRFSNVSTKLIEQLVPGFTSPRRGTLDGQLAIIGGRNAMQLSGNVAFFDPGTGTSRVAGSGFVGFAHGDWRMRNMRVRVDPLQVALVKALAPSLASTIPQIGGTLVGTVSLNGSTGTALAIAGDVEHRDRGGVSHLSGSAGIKLAGVNSFNVDIRARPLALAEVGLLAPALGLHGSASGPIRIQGTLANMRISSALQLSGGGWLRTDGRVNLASRVTSYDVTAQMQIVNLNAVMTKAPETSLTGTLTARGSGFNPATMRVALAGDFTSSTFKGITVDRLSARLAVADGLARVERLVGRANNTTLDASGTFGLTARRSGELRYSVAIDSLGAYDALIPGERAGVERPRTGLVARALQRAHEDSVRVARATEVERAATGRAMPAIPVDTPRSLARSVTTGKVYAAGTLTGNIKRFDTRGRLAAQDVIVRGNSVRSLQAEYAWTNARTADSRLAIGVEGGQISVKGFAFDTLSGRLSYHKPSGELQLAIRQGNERDYSAAASFVLGTRNTVKVNNLAVRMDTTVWTLGHPAVVHWYAAGVEVQDVLLRSNSGGSVYVNGLLPTQGNANLVLDVQNFQIGDVAAFMQSDLPLRGIVTARGVLEGPLSDPRFRGAAGLVNGNYNGSVIPDFQSTFTYASQSLVAHAEALRKGGAPTVVADATLPVNLAITGVTGARILDAPLRVDVSGDSLPLDLIPSFTDAVAQIRGVAVGSFAMRGTLKRPTFAGAVRWANGSVKIVPTGMVVHDIVAELRMARDTIFVDTAMGRSGKGTVQLAGRLLVGSWRTPGFDLHLLADNAEVLNNDHGRIDADVGLSMTGPFDDAYVAGLVRVRQGVGYIPEPSHKNVVNAGDPAVFSVMDTSVMADRELFPTSSPFLEKLRIDVDVTVNRNTWLRSRDANIEMFTEEPVRVHREADALALTGVVSTDRGEYTFLSKRFEIKRGSATFTGGPELNPIVQATGEYEVALAGRPSFNVRVLIGGTLQKPKLTLESDAQPPISQSDLLSYLAFGRSASSLLQLEGSGLTGATATGNLVGVGAALATKRMAAVALGVMADEVEGEATKGLGTDVFNITPADIPTELGSQGVVNFFQSTKIEAGKYLSPYFFMALQAQQYPGIRAEYRTPKGWRYEGTIEPRYLIQPPSLELQPVRPVTAIGAFIIREWRF